MREFSELHRQVLIFEATWRPRSGEVEKRAVVIRNRFNVSMSTYDRLLAEACVHPAALRIAPAAARRLRARYSAGAA